MVVRCKLRVICVMQCVLLFLLCSRVWVSLKGFCKRDLGIVR